MQSYNIFPNKSNGDFKRELCPHYANNIYSRDGLILSEIYEFQSGRRAGQYSLSQSARVARVPGPIVEPLR